MQNCPPRGKISHSTDIWGETFNDKDCRELRCNADKCRRSLNTTWYDSRYLFWLIILLRRWWSRLTYREQGPILLAPFNYRQTSNISLTKSRKLHVSCLVLQLFLCNPLKPGREWRCSWSSADRRCSNYVWVINNFIACACATYIRG